MHFHIQRFPINALALNNIFDVYITDVYIIHARLCITIKIHVHVIENCFISSI